MSPAAMYSLVRLMAARKSFLLVRWFTLSLPWLRDFFSRLFGSG